MVSFLENLYDKYIKGDENDESWIKSRKYIIKFSFCISLILSIFDLIEAFSIYNKLYIFLFFLDWAFRFAGAFTILLVLYIILTTPFNERDN